jgi:RNAse (barnase) inhibitor barstar
VTETKTLVIVGSNIHDIESFYGEINRVFMAAEDRRLGASLDALDDMLRGAYGAISARERISLVWEEMEVSRSGLGFAATHSHLLEKLARPDVFNEALINRQLQELENAGRTYFQMVLEIIADHPNIELIPA